MAETREHSLTKEINRKKNLTVKVSPVGGFKPYDLSFKVSEAVVNDKGLVEIRVDSPHTEAVLFNANSCRCCFMDSDGKINGKWQPGELLFPA